MPVANRWTQASPKVARHVVAVAQRRHRPGHPSPTAPCSTNSSAMRNSGQGHTRLVTNARQARACSALPYLPVTAGR